MLITKMNVEDKQAPEGIEEAVQGIYDSLNGKPMDTAMSALFTVLANTIRNTKDLSIKMQMILGMVDLAQSLNIETAQEYDVDNLASECDTCEDSENCPSKPEHTQQ